VVTAAEATALREQAWVATYAAMFAAQCQAYRERTGECANEETLDGFAEEAGALATEAANRVVSTRAFEVSK
jgi:preprotein translocase subunit SecA